MNLAWKKELENLVGSPVRIHFYVGEGSPFVERSNILVRIGKIVSIKNEIMKFRVCEKEREFRAVGDSMMDLHQINIWSVETLSDDWEDFIQEECPGCGVELRNRGEPFVPLSDEEKSG